eukprot:3522121-Ditylum_brightwellii.AAC.1
MDMYGLMLCHHHYQQWHCGNVPHQITQTQDEVGLPVLPLNDHWMRNTHATVVVHHLPPPPMDTHGKQ